MNTNGNNAVKYISEYKKNKNITIKNKSYDVKDEAYLSSKLDANKNIFYNSPEYDSYINKIFKKILHSNKATEYIGNNDNIFYSNSKRSLYWRGGFRIGQ